MAIDTIKSTAVLDGAIATADIADDAVTADKLANSINTSIAVGAAALPKAGGTMTGTIADFRSTGIDDNSNALAMTIDASENVGIGVTPETWQSGWSALQIGGLTSYYAPTTTSASQSLMINNNAYNDGAWKYLITDEASSYYQLHGGHTFRVAPSGTADTAISWTTGFEVLADGKARAKNGLLFGTDTAAANALDDYEEGTFTPTASAVALSGVTAIYTKIGRVCHMQLDFAFGSNSRTADMQILNMPFSANGNGNCSTGYTDSGLSNIAWFWQGTTIYCYDVTNGIKQQQNFSGKTIRLGCSVEVY